MAMNDTNRKLLLGFLLGAGFGAAVSLLLQPGMRNKLARLLADGAGDVADAMAALADNRSSFKQRKSDRADKKIERRMNNMRAAGF